MASTGLGDEQRRASGILDPYRSISNPMITSTTHGPNVILPLAEKERKKERRKFLESGTFHKYSGKIQSLNFEIEARPSEFG